MERTEVLRLYEHHSDEVYRLAYSYLMNRDDAQDIVQDVLHQRYTKQVIMKKMTILCGIPPRHK